MAGGFTDPNESAEYTCVRELKEELNLNIDPKKLRYLMSFPNVYHYKGISYNTLDLFFEYNIEEKCEVVMEQSEISEICWIKRNELSLEDIAFESQKRFFEKYL